MPVRVTMQFAAGELETISPVSWVMTRLMADPVNDLLATGKGDYFDQLFGQDGDDELRDSGTMQVFLRGGNGDDLPDAGVGSDALRGDSGNDILLGGRKLPPSTVGMAVIPFVGAAGTSTGCSRGPATTL